MKYCEYIAQTILPTEKGELFIRAYKHINYPNPALEPLVIFYEKPSSTTNIRVHDACYTSEVLGSRRCDCKEQLDTSLEYIKEHGGAIIYLQQEGRGIGLSSKIKVYAIQDQGYDTVDANLQIGHQADERSYDVIPEILQDLDINEIALMTNNPRKIEILTELGIQIKERIPIIIPENETNCNYLQTKKDKMRHLL